MAKGSDYGAENKTLSFRLFPVEIQRLRWLARKHGGVGRAIQVAIERLDAKKRSRVNLRTDYKIEPAEGEPQMLMSFSVPPRAAALLSRYATRYFDETRNAVLRVCIVELERIEDEYFMEDPAHKL